MANTFKNKTSRNIGTVATQIGAYIVPNNTQTTAIGLSIANVSNSHITVSAFLNETGNANTFIIRNAPVPVGSTLVIVGGDQKVVLKTGDSIYLQSSIASSVDAVMSILEVG